MLGFQKQGILCWQRSLSDQMVGWFFCQPALHHIVNFVMMEKHSKLKKKHVIIIKFNFPLFCRGVVVMDIDNFWDPIAVINLK